MHSDIRLRQLPGTSLARHAGIVSACLLCVLTGCADLPGGRKGTPGPVPNAAVTFEAAERTGTPARLARRPDGAGAEADRLHDSAMQALRTDKLRSAEAALLQLRQRNPRSPTVHANLGVVYRRMEQYQDALASLLAAQRLAPGDPRVLNELGIVYARLGVWNKACAAYREALTRDPQFHPAVINMAILYDVYLDDAAAALAHYRRYAELNPADSQVRLWIVEVQRRSRADQARPPTRAEEAQCPG
jgi:Flp pilus assembly protein TadD